MWITEDVVQTWHAVELEQQAGASPDVQRHGHCDDGHTPRDLSFGAAPDARPDGIDWCAAAVGGWPFPITRR